MEPHEIIRFAASVLGVTPLAAERMTLTHSGNTIYDVTLPDRNVIVRIRGADRDTLSKTAYNIKRLAQIGLPVPRVIAHDASLEFYPFRYIILEKIPGRDLLHELGDMTRLQMTRLAEQIVAAQRLVGRLPRGAGYGWGHIGEGGPKRSWRDVILPPSNEGGAASCASLPNDFTPRLADWALALEPHFASVEPTCFLEDLTTKNVLLDHGVFQGLIDFDCVCFGDPIWMIGLAAACIVNDIGARGLFYIEELYRCWNLNPKQREAAAFYGALRAAEFLGSALGAADSATVGRLIGQMELWIPG